MYDGTDSMESPPEYVKGDIVWVKLSGCWWPGEVTKEEDLPSDLLADFKKPPLVIVKFFDEDSYEYIKQWSSIYPYDCDKKTDFIKKGMAGYRAKLPHMAKFPKDIGTAEEKTNGNPNILSQPEFLPPKKLNLDEILGTPSPKKSKGLATSKKPTRDNNEALITHRRFIGNDDYKSYIWIQYPCKDRPYDSDEEEIKKLNEEPQEVLSCEACSFKTKRLGVLLIHTKMHLDGVYQPSKRKSKKSKQDQTESETKASVNKSPKPKQQRKKKVAIAEPKSVDVFTDLLEEWNDTDEEMEGKETLEVEESREDKSDSFNKSDIGSPPVTPKSKPSAFNHNVSVDAPVDTTGGKNTQDDIKNCFDFDEEEEEGDFLLPASTGRKIPRVIPEKPRASISELLELSEKEEEEKETEPKGESKEVEVDLSAPAEPDSIDNRKHEILRQSQSFNRKPSVEDPIENSFRELLEETEVPILDDLAETLKPEQNFHDARTVKFPDKGGTTSKKRFVTSFEDFEAGFRKIDDDDTASKRNKEQVKWNRKSTTDNNKSSLAEQIQEREELLQILMEDDDDSKRKSRRKITQFVVEEDSEHIVEITKEERSDTVNEGLKDINLRCKQILSGSKKQSVPSQGVFDDKEKVGIRKGRSISASESSHLNVAEDQHTLKRKTYRVKQSGVESPVEEPVFKEPETPRKGNKSRKNETETQKEESIVPPSEKLEEDLNKIEVTSIEKSTNNADLDITKHKSPRRSKSEAKDEAQLEQPSKHGVRRYKSGRFKKGEAKQVEGAVVDSQQIIQEQIKLDTRRHSSTRRTEAENVIETLQEPPAKPDTKRLKSRKEGVTEAAKEHQEIVDEQSDVKKRGSRKVTETESNVPAIEVAIVEASTESQENVEQQVDLKKQRPRTGVKSDIIEADVVPISPTDVEKPTGSQEIIEEQMDIKKQRSGRGAKSDVVGGEVAEATTPVETPIQNKEIVEKQLEVKKLRSRRGGNLDVAEAEPIVPVIAGETKAETSIIESEKAVDEQKKHQSRKGEKLDNMELESNICAKEIEPAVPNVETDVKKLKSRKGVKSAEVATSQVEDSCIEVPIESEEIVEEQADKYNHMTSRETKSDVGLQREPEASSEPTIVEPASSSEKRRSRRGYKPDMDSSSEVETPIIEREEMVEDLSKQDAKTHRARKGAKLDVVEVAESPIIEPLAETSIIECEETVKELSKQDGKKHRARKGAILDVVDVVEPPTEPQQIVNETTIVEREETVEELSKRDAKRHRVRKGTKLDVVEVAESSTEPQQIDETPIIEPKESGAKLDVESPIIEPQQIVAETPTIECEETVEELSKQDAKRHRARKGTKLDVVEVAESSTELQQIDEIDETPLIERKKIVEELSKRDEKSHRAQKGTKLNVAESSMIKPQQIVAETPIIECKEMVEELSKQDTRRHRARKGTKLDVVEVAEPSTEPQQIDEIDETPLIERKKIAEELSKRDKKSHRTQRGTKLDVAEVAESPIIKPEQIVAETPIIECKETVGELSKQDEKRHRARKGAKGVAAEVAKSSLIEPQQIVAKTPIIKCEETVEDLSKQDAKRHRARKGTKLDVVEVAASSTGPQQVDETPIIERKEIVEELSKRDEKSHRARRGAKLDVAEVAKSPIIEPQQIVGETSITECKETVKELSKQDGKRHRAPKGTKLDVIEVAESPVIEPQQIVAETPITECKETVDESSKQDRKRHRAPKGAELDVIEVAESSQKIVDEPQSKQDLRRHMPRRGTKADTNDAESVSDIKATVIESAPSKAQTIVEEPSTKEDTKGNRPRRRAKSEVVEAEPIVPPVLEPPNVELTSQETVADTKIFEKEAKSNDIGIASNVSSTEAETLQELMADTKKESNIILKAEETPIKSDVKAHKSRKRIKSVVEGDAAIEEVEPQLKKHRSRRRTRSDTKEAEANVAEVVLQHTKPNLQKETKLKLPEEQTLSEAPKEIDTTIIEQIELPNSRRHQLTDLEGVQLEVAKAASNTAIVEPLLQLQENNFSAHKNAPDAAKEVETIIELMRPQDEHPAKSEVQKIEESLTTKKSKRWSKAEAFMESKEIVDELPKKHKTRRGSKSQIVETVEAELKVAEATVDMQLGETELVQPKATIANVELEDTKVVKPISVESSEPKIQDQTKVCGAREGIKIDTPSGLRSEEHDSTLDEVDAAQSTSSKSEVVAIQPQAYEHSIFNIPDLESIPLPEEVVVEQPITKSKRAGRSRKGVSHEEISNFTTVPVISEETVDTKKRRKSKSESENNHSSEPVATALLKPQETICEPVEAERLVFPSINDLENIPLPEEIVLEEPKAKPKEGKPEEENGSSALLHQYLPDLSEIPLPEDPEPPTAKVEPPKLDDVQSEVKVAESAIDSAKKQEYGAVTGIVIDTTYSRSTAKVGKSKLGRSRWDVIPETCLLAKEGEVAKDVNEGQILSDVAVEANLQLEHHKIFTEAKKDDAADATEEVLVNNGKAAENVLDLEPVVPIENVDTSKTVQVEVPSATAKPDLEKSLEKQDFKSIESVDDQLSAQQISGENKGFLASSEDSEILLVPPKKKKLSRWGDYEINTEQNNIPKEDPPQTEEIAKSDSAVIEDKTELTTENTSSEIILPLKKSKRVNEASFSDELKSKSDDSLTFPSYDDSFMSTTMRDNIEGLIKEIDIENADNTFEMPLVKEEVEVPKIVPPKKKILDLMPKEEIKRQNEGNKVEEKGLECVPPKKKIPKLFENTLPIEKATELPLMSPLAKKKSFLFYQEDFEHTDKPPEGVVLSKIGVKRKSTSTEEHPLKKEKIEELMEQKIKDPITFDLPADIQTQPLNEPELVPISVTPTVMSEQDLIDTQVEITPDKVINEKKPTAATLATFSVDFKEDPKPNIQFNLKPALKDSPMPQYSMKSELLDILEGNSNSSTNSSGSEQRFKTSFDNYDKKSTVHGVIDFEDAIPPQIVLSNKVTPESVLMDSPKLLERLSMTSDATKGKVQKLVIQRDVKIPESLSKSLISNIAKASANAKPGQKIVIKTARPVVSTVAKPSGSKPIILSEQIIRPANPTSTIVKTPVQPQGIKRPYEDIEDIEKAFIIPKNAKKIEEKEEAPVTPAVPEKKTKSRSKAASNKASSNKAASNNSGSCKAKILQQTIITPKGEVIPQNPSAAPAPQTVQVQPVQDDTVFDINSMPIVLSDDLLTPESIQNMPVVLSEDVLPQKVAVTSAKPQEKSQPKKPTTGVPTTKQIIFKTTQPVSTPSATIKQTIKPRILTTPTAATLSKIPKSGTTAIVATGTNAEGKPTKYVLVPPSVTPSATQVKTIKQTVTKKLPSAALTQSKIPTTSVVSAAAAGDQIVGNKIMIVTNAQGQQTRVVLTPQQQKAFLQGQAGAKKAIIKGTIPKSLLESAAVAGPSGVVSKTVTPVSQVPAPPVTSHGGGLLMAAVKPVKLSTPATKKSAPKSTKPQKTILIKNQLGQTVRKIQGTDDADLDRQVAEQLEAIKASARLQQATKPPEIINYTNRQVQSSATSGSKQTVRKPIGKKAEPVKPKPIEVQMQPEGHVPSLAPLSPQPKLSQSSTVNALFSKQAVTKKLEAAPAVKSNEVPSMQQKQPDANKTLAATTESNRPESPLRQVVIQDGLGNLTTVTVGQILAIPSETVDGQHQSYMLVTVDESGNLTPLNNDALMSLDPSLGAGGDINNMVLQMDENQGTLAALKPADIIGGVPPVAEEKRKVEEKVRVVPPKQLLQQSLGTSVKEPKIPPTLPPPKVPDVPVAVEQQVVIGEGILPGDAGGQQLIVTGDPIATQKFLESLSDGSTDLASILANAEGGSVLLQTDGQQILIRTTAAAAQPLLGMTESSETGGNPMFGGHKPNQDILAAALANTDVFQQNDSQSGPLKGLPSSQLSPGSGGLYPMNVSNVLETSLTLSSPIMTPLEVPSTNSKKIDDEADILNQVPKNVDLPITITDPNISQTVAHQQAAAAAAGLMELTLPISETGPSVTDINSPSSYSYSLPSLDESVDISQKNFGSSMPLLTEDVVESENSATSSDPDRIGLSKSVEMPPSSSFSSNFASLPLLTDPIIESPREEVVKTSSGFGDIETMPLIGEDVIEDSGSSIGSGKPPRSSPKHVERDIVDEGLSTLGGEMCSSLSEPPPDMFDLSILTRPRHHHHNAKEEAEMSSDDVSSIPEPSETLSVNSENSGEIPLQPPIVANLNDLKRPGDDLEGAGSSDEKRRKFD